MWRSGEGFFKAEVSNDFLVVYLRSVSCPVKVRLHHSFDDGQPLHCIDRQGMAL
jgi:hypothetical protein